ncbi:hypothetical protein [Nocardioides lijunqiniae]|uniref:hypothetical protein n=1 Tax=Nocardioides lijunqiniae TaxID=2760832 RepID=UPI00187894DD|nr:hypothetical protein [Nocardioides lijunqiniae]
MTGPALPEGFYDASAAAPAATDPGAELEQAVAHDATRRLEDALGRVAEHVARAREEEQRDGLDDQTRALLEGLTGAPDAPLEWRSLHDRVASGATSWERVWAEPTLEAGGRDLVLAVIGAQVEAATQARAAFVEAAARGEHDEVPGAGGAGRRG